MLTLKQRSHRQLSNQQNDTLMYNNQPSTIIPTKVTTTTTTILHYLYKNSDV